MAAGAIDKRWRRNPFTETYEPNTVSGEEHVCEYIEEFDAYGIFANEAVRFDNPSTVVVEEQSGPTTYTEVSKASTPGATEYRVDYDEEGYFNTGFIELASSNNGKTFQIDYIGLGTINHPNFRLNTNTTVPGDLDISGNLLDTVLKDGLSFRNNAGVIVGLLQPYLSTDGTIRLWWNRDESGLKSYDGRGCMMSLYSLSSGTDKVVSLAASAHGLQGSGHGAVTFMDILTTGIKFYNSGMALVDGGNEGIYGFLDDGTKLKAKWLSGTILNGNTSLNLAHGITNAYTNKLILGITEWIDSTAAMYTKYLAGNSSVPTRFYYNNTNVTVERGGSSGDKAVYVLVVYKD